MMSAVFPVSPAIATSIQGPPWLWKDSRNERNPPGQTRLSMRHVCFGDDGRNTVKGQARCRVIAQQMSAYNLLQYGQYRRQHRQQIGCYGSDRIEVYHPVLLTIFTTDHPNQGGEVFAVTIVKRFRHA